MLRMRPGLVSALAGSAVALSACMGAPTYGTGTPADQQLVEDLTGALSLAPKDRPKIEYAPRPGIVMPPSTEVLPPPQEDVTATSPQWPESPEERLARIRAEATARQDDPTYNPGIIRDIARNDRPQGPRNRWNDTDFQDAGSAESKREAFNRRLAENRQGSPATRRYLSDPPLDLRQPAPTAPVGDVGEDEWRKQRDAERIARQSRPRAWENMLPGP